MPVVHVAPADECADAVASVVAEAVRGRDPVIGVATGRTTAPLHARLVEMHRLGSLDANSARWLMLDEFLDLADDDACTYRNTLRRDLVDPLGADPAALIGPRLSLGDAETIADEFRRVSEGVRVDVQVLGIGRNGHVGFNEPGSGPTSRTRVVSLSTQTLADLAGPEWGSAGPPRRAVTRGVADICHARTIVLLAFGSAKSTAVHAALRGPVTPQCPASLLRDHADLRLFLDAEAAVLL